MRRHWIILLVALFALAGCNTVFVTDKNGASGKCSGMGRGCCAINVETDGTTEAIGSFDATSDWLALKIVPQLFRGAVSILLGRPDPNAGGTSDPSGIGGCDSLFADDPVEEDQPGGVLSFSEPDGSGVWMISPPAPATEEE